MYMLLQVGKFALGWLLFIGILLHAAVCELFKDNVSKERNIDLDTTDSQYDPLSKQHGATHT